MTRSQRYVVQPQRRSKGWISCPEHQAQRWAVCHLPSTRAVGAFGTKAEAQAVSDTMNARLKRRSASSEPGSRYGATGQRGSGRIIASEGDYS